jgi:hypothetical protein
MIQGIKDKLFKDSELFNAIKKQNLDRVNYLLENNADPNKRNGDGVIPLSRAIRLYYNQKMNPDFDQSRFDTSYAIIRALVEKGADPNVGSDFIRNNEEGRGIYMRTQTPLILGLKELDTELMDYLILKGANVNLVTTDNVYQGGYTYTPLTWVLENFEILSNSNPRVTTLEAVKYLLSKDADPRIEFEYRSGKSILKKSPLTVINSYDGRDKDEIKERLINKAKQLSVNNGEQSVTNVEPSINPLINQEILGTEKGGRRRRRKTNKKRKTNKRRKTGKRRRR